MLSGLLAALRGSGSLWRGRSLTEFQRNFPTRRVRGFLIQRRWPTASCVRPAAASRRRAESGIHLRCYGCGRQTSITAGTAMHRARLPLTAWFWAALCGDTFQRHVGAAVGDHSASPTNRLAAGATAALDGRSGRELLEGVVEVDQAEFLSVKAICFSSPATRANPHHWRCRGVERDTHLSKPRRKHAKYLDTRSGRVRLAVIADNTAASIEAFVRANVKPGATLLTDGHASYPGLTDYRHDPRIVGKMAAHIVLP